MTLRGGEYRAPRTTPLRAGVSARLKVEMWRMLRLNNTRRWILFAQRF
jgi:hypothetical protein